MTAQCRYKLLFVLWSFTHKELPLIPWKYRWACRFVPISEMTAADPSVRIWHSVTPPTKNKNKKD